MTRALEDCAPGARVVGGTTNSGVVCNGEYYGRTAAADEDTQSAELLKRKYRGALEAHGEQLQALQQVN